MTVVKRPELTDGVVVLRAPRHGDAAGRFKLGNTPEIHHMFGADPAHVPVISKAHADLWFDTQIAEPFAWVIQHKKQMIGAVRLHSLNSWDGRASVAIGILDKKLLGKGIGTRALHLLAIHAFDTLALHRLSARVLGYNMRGIASFGKVGFAEEGRERQSAFVAGTWHDAVLMGLLKSEYVRPVYPAPKPRKSLKTQIKVAQT